MACVLLFECAITYKSKTSNYCYVSLESTSSAYNNENKINEKSIIYYIPDTD